MAAPHEPPYSLTKDEDERGREIDALHTLAPAHARASRASDWPDVLLMLGDQVYADEVSPGHARVHRDAARHRPSRPASVVLDFEEYTRLYRESWSDPAIRWLLSTVSTAMIFDDHDVHDDWNISAGVARGDARSTDWWDEHIMAALSSYWVYQHLGNLSPEAHRDDELLSRGEGRRTTPSSCSRSSRFRADRETDGARWSYCRDLGSTRLIVIDSRAGRVLEEGRRSMLDERRVGLGRTSTPRATSTTC